MIQNWLEWTEQGLRFRKGMEKKLIFKQGQIRWNNQYKKKTKSKWRQFTPAPCLPVLPSQPPSHLFPSPHRLTTAKTSGSMKHAVLSGSDNTAMAKLLQRVNAVWSTGNQTMMNFGSHATSTTIGMNSKSAISEFLERIPDILRSENLLKSIRAIKCVK